MGADLGAVRRACSPGLAPAAGGNQPCPRVDSELPVTATRAPAPQFPHSEQDLGQAPSCVREDAELASEMLLC